MHDCSARQSNDNCGRVIPNSDPSFLHQSGQSETESTVGHNKIPTSKGSTRSLVDAHGDGPPNPAARRRHAEEQLDENETAKWRRLDRSLKAPAPIWSRKYNFFRQRFLLLVFMIEFSFGEQRDTQKYANFNRVLFASDAHQGHDKLPSRWKSKQLL